MLFLSTRGLALLLSAFPRVIDYRERYSTKCCKDTEKKKKFPVQIRLGQGLKESLKLFLKRKSSLELCVSRHVGVCCTHLWGHGSQSLGFIGVPRVPRTEADASTFK